ncbi:MAG TPA: iron donor protein CyaY [Rubrivivax sp.]|nr:iron donor protein CyaY [Rubrivivax sp.]
MSPSLAPDPLTDTEYRQLGMALVAGLEATIDRWLQQDLIDIDSSRSGGMLEMTFPDDSRIVVNLQPPLQEIWVAARQGGFHYRCVGGRWLDTRDGSELLASLSRHASAQGGMSLDFRSG